LAAAGADAAMVDPEASPSGAPASDAPIPDERHALCERPADDAVRDIFCKGRRATVGSLRELLARLEIEALPVDMDEAAAAMIQYEPNAVLESAVLLGHSTALSGQLVSPINPRAILLNRTTQIAFQRGVQKVEIVTQDRQSGRRNFYLVSFLQACNETSAGCLPGDLYTLDVERGWTRVVLEDDEDLKNTPRDCRMCHQRKLDAPILLMREVLGPWLHFFFIDRDGDPYQEGEGPSGRKLVRDYRVAKGNETYAGIGPSALRHTAGVTLERALRSAQPLQFDPTVEVQVNTGGGATPGRSAIWDALYASFKRGQHLALPYFRADPTDPRKRAALSEAYARYRRGELARAALPELSDIFPDDAHTRAEIGLQTEPDATPAETLIQACGSCHNDVLDQGISRARFNIALPRMSREELDLAIARITAAPSSEEVMPPKGMRQLDPAAKLRLLDYLMRRARDAQDDTLLENAARMGMAENVNYAGL
jgi:hypothetical protein